MILDITEICSKMDYELTNFIHNIIILIKIAVPIILILFGMIDMGKGVVAGKEDEIKKGQNTFIKRLIAGVVVFFMVSITQLVITIIDKESNGEFWKCANDIMNGKTQQEIEYDNKEKQNEQNRNEAIKEWCSNASGSLTENNGKNSCTLENNEQTEKNNQCFKEKTK